MSDLGAVCIIAYAHSFALIQIHAASVGYLMLLPLTKNMRSNIITPSFFSCLLVFVTCWKKRGKKKRASSRWMPDSSQASGCQ
jgi:hypothetical protein